MRVLDCFAGIGGFSLGLERAGMETVAFCEIDPFCQQVLAKHWPNVPIYDDIRGLSRERLKSDGIGGIDVVTGGFPCQDLSFAGRQAGITGERSGLWSELCRVIGDIRPRYAIMENVTALISGDSGRWFGRVLGDLAEIGYDAEWHCIPASYLGAPHRRDRIWIVANPSRLQRHGGELYEKHSEGEVSEFGAGIGADNVAHANSPRLEGRSLAGNSSEVGPWVQQFIERCPDSDRPTWRSEPDVGRVAHGVPDRAHRLKALGNAVVPQIPELIGRAIMEQGT
jgi:DNA (cytosine-5)-methyltransferase 1